MDSYGGRKRSNRLLYVVSLNHFVNDSSSFLIASLFPAMEIAFGFSTYYIGLLVAVGYVVLMVLQPIVGVFSEKIQPLKLLPLGFSVTALSLFIFMFSSNFLTILLSFIVLRIGTSFFHPIGAVAISKAYAGERLDRSMGVESASGNLGIIFAFLTSAPLYLAFGWKGPFIAYASIVIITTALTLILSASPSLKINIYYGLKEKQQKKSEKLGNHTNELSRRGLFLGLPLTFVILGFITGGSNAVFGNFGNLILFHNGFSVGLSNYLIAIFEFLGFVGAFATGWLTLRIKRINLLFLSYFISGAGMLAFSFINGESYVFMIPFLVSGFALSLAYPITYSEISDFSSLSDGRRSGTGFGILFSSQIGGSALMGYVSGYFSKTVSLNLSFAISALLLLVASIIVVIWGKFYRVSYKQTKSEMN